MVEQVGKKFKSNHSDDQAETEYKHCGTFMQNMSKAFEEDEDKDHKILAAEQEIHLCSECVVPIVGGRWCDIPNCNGARALPPGGFQGWGGTPLGKKMEQKKWQCPDCLCWWPMTAKAWEFSKCESNKNKPRWRMYQVPTNSPSKPHRVPMDLPSKLHLAVPQPMRI